MNTKVFLVGVLIVVCWGTVVAVTFSHPPHYKKPFTRRLGFEHSIPKWKIQKLPFEHPRSKMPSQATHETITTPKPIPDFIKMTPKSLLKSKLSKLFNIYHQIKTHFPKQNILKVLPHTSCFKRKLVIRCAEKEKLSCQSKFKTFPNEMKKCFVSTIQSCISKFAYDMKECGNLYESIDTCLNHFTSVCQVLTKGNNNEFNQCIGASQIFCQVQ